MSQFEQTIKPKDLGTSISPGIQNPEGPIVIENNEVAEKVVEKGKETQSQENSFTDQAKIVKKLDAITNIEKTREELGVTDINIEETTRIAVQKKELEDKLGGNALAVKDEKNDIEKDAKNVLNPPQQKIELKESAPFDIKKVYSALENVLTVFDGRARRVRGFDIMPQSSFDSLVDLYNFMQEKVIGKNSNEVGEKVNLDLTSPDEINKQLIEKFEIAMNSIEVTPTGGWQSSGSQEEYHKDMEDIRDVMGSLSQELAPLATELKKGGPYASSAGTIEAAVEKTNNLAGLFNHKAETFAEYMG